MTKAMKRVNDRFSRIANRQFQVLVLSDPTSNKEFSEVSSAELRSFCPNPKCRSKMTMRLVELYKDWVKMHGICPKCKQYNHLSIFIGDAKIVSHVRKTRNKLNLLNDESHLGKEWKKILDKNNKEIVKEELEKT